MWFNVKILNSYSHLHFYLIYIYPNVAHTKHLWKMKWRWSVSEWNNSVIYALFHVLVWAPAGAAAGVSTVASQRGGPRSDLLSGVLSLFRGLWFPPTVQVMQLRLNGAFKWLCRFCASLPPPPPISGIAEPKLCADLPTSLTHSALVLTAHCN